jgi:hypothetical protein
MKAVYSVGIRSEDLKQAVRPDQFKHDLGRWRYCCEPGIPITLHGFFQAGQKQVKNWLVHLT